MNGWFEPSLAAAFLSAIAAIFAAIATWRGPRSAAQMAERLRRESENEQDSRRFRLNIFATLMQSRAEIWSEDSVRALNSIDVAFSKTIPVREAWAELHQALNSIPFLNHVVDERIRRLLREMAKDLGLSETLRQDDFGRVYFPTALAEERNVRDLERKAALQRLTSAISPAANVADSQAEIEKRWPPKPETEGDEGLNRSEDAAPQ